MIQAGRTLAVGTLLAGKYRIEHLLGRGGMGTVMLAHHEELDHRVAIKVLTSELAANAEVVARFTREARAAAKLQSEHVVRVSDVGRAEGIGPYMVMEYLQGADLGVVLEKRGPLPVQEAVDYVLEAIDALAEAHSIGIVHRDLKPSNLYLADRADGTQTIKVLDFGISKVDVINEPATAQQKLTSTRSVIGSPGYMSPEQLKSPRDVDARADVWSIGVMLYELLTRTQPFDGETVGQLFANILSESPKPLRPRRADVSEALEGIIMRCLERDPKARFVDVGELAQALAPLGSGRASKEVQRAVSLLRRRAAAPSDVPATTLVVDPLRAGTEGPLPVQTHYEKTQNTWAASRLRAPGRRGTVFALSFGGVFVVGLAILGAAVILKRDRAPQTDGIQATVTRDPVVPSAVPSAPEPTAIAPQIATVAPVTTSSTPKASATIAATHARPTTTKTAAAHSTTPPSFLDRQR